MRFRAAFSTGPQGELAEVMFRERPVRRGGLVQREDAGDMHLERARPDQAVELGDRPGSDGDVVAAQPRVGADRRFGRHAVGIGDA